MKTIAKILTLASFIPGPQQPFIAAAAAIANIAVAVSALGSGQAAKPEQVETSIKTERPVRVKGYGRTRRYGASLLYESQNGKTIDVWAFHDGRANAIVRTYLNDDMVTVFGNTVQTLPDKRYQNGFAKVGYTLGRPVETAFAAVYQNFPGWSSNHRGDGLVTGYLIKEPEKEKFFLETYPQGDNVELSLVGEWTLTFDPRDPAQDPYDPETWTWSENAVRAYIHYLMVERGFDWNYRFQPRRAQISAAIDDADTPMPLAAGGTEPRYRTALSYKANDEPANIMSSLLACFDGWSVINDRGEVVLYSGRLYEPTVSIGPDQIVSFRHQAGVADEDFVNEIAIPYVSDQHDYNTVDGQAWRDEDDIGTRGKINPSELGAVVPSHTQGRRLAKRKMARNNASDRGSCTTTYAGRGVLEQRYIYLRLEEAGTVFFEGVVEVVAAERDMMTGGTSFEWSAVDPNTDAWNPVTEDGEGAAIGNRYAPPPLTRPTITSAITVFTESTDAGTGARIEVIATTPETIGLTWYVRWRRDPSSVWNEQEFPDEDPGPAVQLLTGFVPLAPTLQVQVEYRTADGRLSGWSASATLNSRTSTVAPDDAVTISVVSWSDTLSLTTDRIPRATSYRWRFYTPDGATLKRQIVTTTPAVGYTSAQAAVDGALRSYQVKVAGVNSAGAGAEAVLGSITLPAPPALTGVSATGGEFDAQVAFDLSAAPSVAGYIIPVSTVANFNPLTQGTIFQNLGSSPAYLQGLAAGTFYAKVAAYDAWTDRPDLLNFSVEASFEITTGGGGVGTGGGDGGGGYCPHVDTLILLANATGDGPGEQLRAGDLAVGDLVWTQHEADFRWGAYPVEAISFVRRDILRADLGVTVMRATPGHLVWLGGGWTAFEAFGVPDGRARVARITVTDAHTYVSNGVLSHNLKPIEPQLES